MSFSHNPQNTGNSDPLSLTLGGPVVPLVCGFIRGDIISWLGASCLRTAISKTRNGEWRNGERGTGNGESLKGGISKRGNL